MNINVNSKSELKLKRHVTSLHSGISAIITIPVGRVKKPVNAVKLWIKLARTSKETATSSVPGRLIMHSYAACAVLAGLLNVDKIQWESDHTTP